MLTAHLAGDRTLAPKTGRKPLQPTNSLSTPPNNNPAKNETPRGPIDGRNKENPHSVIPAIIDASLAEELSEVRRRGERLREEREKTEGVMRERGMVLERMMEEVRVRGEVQRRLEIQVDRLFRLKEIQTQSKKNSPIRSLREKEGGEKIKEDPRQNINSESTSECNSGT